MGEQEIGDRAGLLDGRQVRGAGHQREPGVRYPRDQGARVTGPGHPVLGPDHDQRGDRDAAQLRTDVERGQGLAGGDVAPGVGGPHHLDGPLDDGGLRGGERGREPALGRGARHGLQAVRTDDDPALPELVRAAEPGRRRHQRERGDPVRVPQREVRPDRAADRAPRVPEPLDPDPVERRQQPVPQLRHSGRGPGGRPAVAGEVVAEDSPVPGELGYLAIPHVPGGAEGGPDHQDRRVLGAVEAVLQGVRRCITHALHPLMSHGQGSRGHGLPVPTVAASPARAQQAMSAVPTSAVHRFDLIDQRPWREDSGAGRQVVRLRSAQEVATTRP